MVDARRGGRRALLEKRMTFDVALVIVMQLHYIADAR